MADLFRSPFDCIDCRVLAADSPAEATSPRKKYRLEGGPAHQISLTIWASGRTPQFDLPRGPGCGAGRG